MTSHSALRLTRGLSIAGFALGAVAAQAANGFTVTQSEESMVRIGMTETEVQQALGHPAQTNRYRNKPGPTWSYQVQAAPFGRTNFDIDFGSDGKVVAAGEQIFGDR